MSFETWMKKINNMFLETYSIDYDSFPDLICIRDIFDEGVSIEDAFELLVETLEDEGELNF